jgi:hypothetical protein
MNKLRVAGVALPVIIGLIIAAQIFAVGMKPSLYAPWAFIFFNGAYLGRFMYLLSQGREATFFSTTITPTDTRERRLSAEGGAWFGAALLIMTTLLVPVLVKV